MKTWEKVFRTFYDDNEEGGSSRWRVSPDVVEAFVKEQIRKAQETDS